jgi:predicted lipoprotein
MLRKAFKYTLTVAALAVIVSNSVYIKRLDEVKASSLEGQFNATSYARQFWEQQLLPNLSRAIEVNQLVALLKTNPESTFEAHSNALGIGNIRFFLVQGQGEVAAINENDVTVVVGSAAGQREVRIATEYIFGNAVRDASGLIDINAFDNTMHFNNVSAELNTIIRMEVLPPFKASVQKDQVVTFTGAIELNQEYLNLEEIEVIPIALTIPDKENL